MARFMVSYTFHGRASETIEAETLEVAQGVIEEKVNKDYFDLDAEEIDDVDFRVAEMHPVTRDGKEVWTTYVRATDQRGFQSALTSAPLFADGGGA